jgi:hypothetical protein
MTESTSPDPKDKKKNEHAAALGRLGGLKGGKARAAALTPEELKASGKKAADARWGGIPKETHPGFLRIGDMEIKCAVLDSGLRVVSQRGFYRAIAKGNPSGRRGEDADETVANGDDNIPAFLAAANLKPFISERLTAAATPIVYREMPDARMKGGGGFQVAHGLDAKLIPEICEVWLRARDKGALHYKQKPIALKAEILMRGLATVGIIALIDEVTGYQADRDRDELTRILQAYIAEELQPWLSRFPHEFFKQIHRLWGWVYVEGKANGPRYVGKLINKYIYERLPTGVLPELQRKNPSINGRRKHAHYRWLTENTGIPHLDKQIVAVTTLLAVSDDKAMFESLLKKRFPKMGDNLDLPFPRLSDEPQNSKDEEE